MALSSGATLALAIISVITAGIIIVVAIVAIYQCARAKYNMERYLQMQHEGMGDNRRHASIAYRDGGPIVVEEAVVEMGNMSFFIEGVQNERPIRFSSQQLRGFTQGFAHKLGSGGFGVVYRGC